MKHILVPVDFSQVSENAMFYAVSYARKMKADITLLHIIDPDEFEGDDNALQAAEKNAELKFRSFETRIKHAGDLSYSHRIVKGELTSSILKSATSMNADLLVMGTRGESNMTDSIFGSNAMNLIEEAELPVLAVPEGVSYNGPIRITFATDYHPSDLDALRFILKLIGRDRPQINFLHVSPLKEDMQKGKDAMKHFMEEVTQKINYNNLSFQLISSDNLDGAIEEHISMGGADLLVMSTRHRNIWQKLFGKSETGNIAQKAIIPLLAFHHQPTSVKIF